MKNSQIIAIKINNNNNNNNNNNKKKKKKKKKNYKFIYTTKWYIEKLASYNWTFKILCDFEIKTDHLISARRPDVVIINKKKNENVPSGRLCRLNGPESWNQRKW